MADTELVGRQSFQQTFSRTFAPLIVTSAVSVVLVLLRNHAFHGDAVQHASARRATPDSMLRNREARRIADDDDSQSEDSITLSSVEDFFASVLDDILVGFGSAQLAIADDVQLSLDARATVEALHIGKPVYIFAVLVVNILLLLVLLQQSLHTGRRLALDLDTGREGLEGGDSWERLRVQLAVNKGLLHAQEGGYTPALIPR
ncbi:hypothetical protein ASPZODRAFT_2129494 [Penicilliopsis zonata CBS 506.65]|uniref:Uncharacterized protein n=1 Tax=Penicilliopsis zonata CBS 506.65 TaxID=1073090 RepID=A0A1L9SH03_9EURO|nr:hypothetical protein ASPZODRAFT_2129494 [Penicilliopsis zonata CBS 506.65]OJJ46472.1 hypothetical protein ASPZODRAFT_2129494 [Penicilliopsis zonata CBS 506.65]